MSATDPTPQLVAIAASFTVEPIEEPLRFLLETVPLAFDVRFAAYDQVFQELLAPASVLGANGSGVNVLLVRFEDYLRKRDLSSDVTQARQLIESTARELSGALSDFAGRSRVPLVLCLFTRSPVVPEALREDIERASAQLATHARGLQNVSVLDAADYEPYAVAEPWDSRRDEMAHIPFTEAFFAAVAAALCRRVHALQVPARKVLVLDCDNTLWQGVVGEDGVDGIRFDPPFLALQRFALAQQAKGVLLCLCSKNTEKDALEVLEKRSDCLLRSEHVVSYRINWDSKTKNLISIAEELNLGLDSFVFIDDSEIECGKVRAELPQVLTLNFQADADVAQRLEHLWAFDKISVTEEDRVRTRLYREDASRQELGKTAASVADFVAGLGLEIEISAPTEDEWSRSSQLTQRTNQFNFTTVRRSEAELRASSASGLESLRVRVRDRFGDYGLVGLMLFKASENQLRVDSFLLSCRALGRGVEHRMLQTLGEVAMQRGLHTVILPLFPSAKNEPARLFGESVAKDYGSQHELGVEYRLPTSIAAAVAYQPSVDAEAGPSSGPDSSQDTPRSTRGHLAKSDAYSRLASELSSADAICKAVAARRTRQRRLTTEVTAPANETEQRLVGVWQRLLGLTSLGTADDYFELGGTSLLAAQLFSEIQQEFGVRLPLTSIVEAPTVRQLAELLSPSGVRVMGGRRDVSLVELKKGIGTRCLFLVHDGDGESLLYRNLAHELPTDISVYGIEPGSLDRVPLPHIRVEDMAREYVKALRVRQPHGPYYLGGMCAGGTLAFAMALELEKAGQSVPLVAILDAAAPNARLKVGLTSKRRWERFASLAAEAESARNWKELGRRTNQAARKIKNLVRYEVRQRADLLSADARFWLLEEVLERGIAWPEWLPALTIRQIYERAAAHYAPGVAHLSRVILFRATEGEGADEPFRMRYEDPALGWSVHTNSDFEVIDIPGGHASMLQESNVKALAREFRRLLRPKQSLRAIHAQFDRSA